MLQSYKIANYTIVEQQILSLSIKEFSGFNTNVSEALPW